MTETTHSQIIILGSGPAGATAAIYAARANRNPTLIHGIQPGGQMTITTDVENYPGFADVIQGPWLMEQFAKQAENVGTNIVNDHIKDVDFSQKPLSLTGESGNVYTADAVVIATGAQAKWLGLDSETEYQGFGVSGCATCDGFFFRDQDVAIVGGGNTALEEALFMTNHAKKVYVIHRRDQFRGERVLQDRVINHEKIEVIWDHILEEVVGTDDPKEVTGIRIKNVKTNDEQTIDLHGVFIAIGHKPNTDLFKDTGLDMDENGYLVTQPDSTKTNIDGVYAAGDVQDHIYRQAVTAAGTGCMAALEIEKYLDSIGVDSSSAQAA